MALDLFAESPSAAVMKFERTKTVSAEFAETISAVVRNEAQQIEKYDVVNKFPIEFNDILMALDCKVEDNNCLLKAANHLNARILVFGGIDEVEGRIRIRVNVFDSLAKKIDKRLIRSFDPKKDPVVEFRKELQIFFGTKKVLESKIKIESNIPRAKIFLNNKWIGEVPRVQGKVKAGTYQIRVEAQGYISWETRVSVKEGDELQVWAQLQEDPTKTKTKEKTKVVSPLVTKTKTLPDLKKKDSKFIPDPVEESSLNWGALATTGVGLGLMGGSLVFGAQLKDTQDSIDRERRAGTLTRARYDDLESEGKTQETIHLIMLGTGAAVTTVGLVWFAISPTFSEYAIEFQVSPQKISARLSF